MIKAEKVFHKMLSEMIEIQGLDDVSDLSKPDFFEEVPFFTRASDVAFLGRLGREGAEKLLIEFALGYLGSVIRQDSPNTGRLAAITIVDHGQRDIFVPNLFVYNGTREHLVESGFTLMAPRSAFAAKIQGIVEQCELNAPHVLLEDRKSIPRRSKIFIGEEDPPEGVFRITDFAAIESKSNGRHE